MKRRPVKSASRTFEVLELFRDHRRPLRLNAPWWFWNMFGEQGVFLLSRGD
jgi:hypothetical protein